MVTLAECAELIPVHEKELISDVEHDCDAALETIESAYSKFLAPLVELRKELAERTAFAELKAPKDKEEAKQFRDAKKVTDLWADEGAAGGRSCVDPTATA
jgi:hypothetical protein